VLMHKRSTPRGLGWVGKSWGADDALDVVVAMPEGCNEGSALAEVLVLAHCITRPHAGGGEQDPRTNDAVYRCGQVLEHEPAGVAELRRLAGGLA
jgi:hypothetical protein